MYAVLFFCGIFTGCIIFAVISKVRKKKPDQPVGTLRVDSSDPYDGPHLFLELSREVGDISKMEYVTLRVDTESYISQQ